MIYTKIHQSNTATFGEIHRGDIFLDDVGKLFIKTDLIQDEFCNCYNSIDLNDGDCYEFSNDFIITIPKYKFEIYD